MQNIRPIFSVITDRLQVSLKLTQSKRLFCTKKQSLLEIVLMDTEASQHRIWAPANGSSL